MHVASENTHSNSLLPGKKCHEEGAPGWDSAGEPISGRARDFLLDLRLNTS